MLFYKFIKKNNILLTARNINNLFMYFSSFLIMGNYLSEEISTSLHAANTPLLR